jgi:hypothetical protein
LATFPFTTPQRGGYNDAEVGNVLRSNMGYGPAKLRVRTAAVLDNVVAVFTTDDVGYVTMKAFYTDNKSIQFDWDNTLGNGVQQYRFISPPQYQEATCDVWRIQVQLERMPK